MNPDNSQTALKTTPLDRLHRQAGAKMVPFAGYSMPVQYSPGIIREHNHTRTKAGLFDVSHMGQVRLSGADAASALETLVPIDVVDLAAGHQRYALFTDDNGGILDDLMVTNTGDSLFLVVNAACKHQDITHLQEHIGDLCQIDILDDRALLALQGPDSALVMDRLATDIPPLLFMQGATICMAGIDCYATRSGYTGEDGFEISVAATQAETLARALLAEPEVEAIGLGARDTLRLEAGLCLYGHDMDTTTTPIEASLTWAISKSRRLEGQRGAGFPGADRILRQMAEGVSKRRVGIQPLGRAPVREGVKISDKQGQVIGAITSGGFGPTLQKPVAMGYVETMHAKPGTSLNAMSRGKDVPVEVTRLPFVKQRYYRG